MSVTCIDAPRRERSSIARYVEKMQVFLASLPPKLKRREPHLSDQLARDIGMSQAELERHRLQLPSQTDRHPRV